MDKLTYPNRIELLFCEQTYFLEMKFKSAISSNKFSNCTNKGNQQKAKLQLPAPSKGSRKSTANLVGL